MPMMREAMRRMPLSHEFRVRDISRDAPGSMRRLFEPMRQCAATLFARRGASWRYIPPCLARYFGFLAMTPLIYWPFIVILRRRLVSL